MKKRWILFLCGVMYLPFLMAGELSVREYWIESMVRIIDPVLTHLSIGRLRSDMPVEIPPLSKRDRGQTSYFEAFARTMVGISPWLELGADTTQEGILRQQYIQKAQRGISIITDPNENDFFPFDCDRQGLVDAAFLAQAFLRAPEQLWYPLDKAVQKRVVYQMKQTRHIKPLESNWLLFSAMIETFLLRFTGEWKQEVVDYAFYRFEQWYKGDSYYGDGPSFHYDYYNSLVIHPMMFDILQILDKVGVTRLYDKNTYLKRFSRHAQILEKMISPEGSYPIIGRSMCYRFGVFHLLSQMAASHLLPASLSPASVREGLNSVLQRHYAFPSMFDTNGWLTLGFTGHQPHLAESYLSTGSLYLCTVIFLPLGLPAHDPFWSARAEDWSAKKGWSEQEIYPDKYLKNE